MQANYAGCAGVLGTGTTNSGAWGKDNIPGKRKKWREREEVKKYRATGDKERW